MYLLFYRHLFQNHKDEDWEDAFPDLFPGSSSELEDDQEQVGHRRKVKRKQVLP